MTYVVWHYVLYRIFNKLFFVTLNVFRFSFIEMKLTCVWCIFRFFFFLIFSFVFLKLWLSLLLNTQNYENNYEGAERKRREKEEKKQKTYSIGKSLKFGTPHLTLYPQTSNFGLSTTYFWAFQSPGGISEFSSKTLTIRSTKWRTAFFCVNTHNIYYYRKYNKTDRKANTLYKKCFLRIWSHLLKKSLMENFIFLCSDTLSTSRFLWKANVPSASHYRTTS